MPSTCEEFNWNVCVCEIMVVWSAWDGMWPLRLQSIFVKNLDSFLESRKFNESVPYIYIHISLYSIDICIIHVYFKTMLYRALVHRCDCITNRKVCLEIYRNIWRKSNSNVLTRTQNRLIGNENYSMMKSIRMRYEYKYGYRNAFRSIEDH